MLLIRGEHLAGARFEVSGAGARIALIRVSANGHWAFIRLDLKGAHAEKVHLIASNSSGKASAVYSLGDRRTAVHPPAGISSQDIVYLIMTDRFADGDPSNDHQPGMPFNRKDPHAWHGGDVAGIDQRLDYLQDLGATAVWLTPLDENAEPTSYHGYGATDMYRVDPHFGDMTAVRKLADDLHRRHMKLVLDIVPNHVGPAHPWVDDEPAPDWFHGTKAHHLDASGDFQSLMDPNASTDLRKRVTDGWFVGILPDMNQGDPLVAEYLIQNTIWWIEMTRADALRLDTFPYVDRAFWAGFHGELRKLYPRLTTVGEVFNGTFQLPPALNSFFAGGVTREGRDHVIDTGLWTPFDYPFFSVVREVLLHGRPMSDLSLLFAQDALYPHPERLATLIGSHDTRRIMGEPGATAAQVRLAFGLMLTVRGMPVIYSGDELGMAGGDDPDNRRDFPGGFPPGNRAVPFGNSAVSREGSAIFDWVTQLDRIRETTSELRSGEQQTLASDDDTFSFARGSQLQAGCAADRRRVLVVVNRGNTATTVALHTGDTALRGCTRYRPLLTGGASIASGSGSLSLSVAPESIGIFEAQ